MSANIDIRLLGPLEIAASRGPVVLHGSVQRTLVARLGVRPGETVSREALVDALWDELPPRTATKTLHSHLARLRHQLQDASLAGLIAAQGPGYALLAPAEAADVVRFEAMVDRGREALAGGATETAVELLRQALGLWRGDPLVECRPGEWVRAEAAHLAEIRLAATENLISARLRVGEHLQLVGELEPLVIRYPFRERVWELLMLALYRSGRQADALAAFQRARTALVDELGIEPGRELHRLEAAILAADPTLELNAPRRTTTGTPVCRRLPVPLTSLIDREADKAALGDLAAGRRLVTLIGPGGCGKTRLAIAVAAEHSEAVCFVDLTPLAKPELVPQAVAEAFGLRAQAAGRGAVDSLVDHLHDRSLLLVLDNCEHLVDACAHLVSALLPACPGLRVLATSRETLRVPGEAVYTLQPLATPDPKAVPAYDELLHYDSVRLFVERTRDAGGQIGTDGATAQGLATICAQLDGLPLALELAAALTAALPVPRIAEQLTGRFPALCSGSRTARPQHRAMRTAIRWSYDLLDDDERALFRRLAVFVGGFDLPGVEALWPRADAVELLGRLVDKSLVVREWGNARYRLLDTIHRFAAEQLADDEKCADVRQRHAEFYLALTEQAQEHLDGADAVEWLDRLTAEHENFRAAMAWAVAQPNSTALRLSVALTRYCQLRGHYRDGRRWLAAALDRGAHTPLILRGNALYGSAVLTFLQCDYDAAVPLAKQAMAMYESLNDLEGTARTRTLLGSIWREQADYPRAMEFHRRALDTFREAGDARGIAEALQRCAFSAWLQGDFDPAQQWAQESLQRMRHLGDAEGAAGALLHLGAIAHYRGDQAQALRLLSEARQTSERTGCPEGIAWALNLLGLVHRATGSASATALLQQSLAVHRKLGDRWRMASVLEALAALACDERRWEHAAQLLDEAATLRAAINSPVPPCERPSHERTRAALATAEQIAALPH
ncbi:BTAD domain-containing putative transcriptional regulator [Kibdelosporangium aridum]|uniref:BTAD domain-containing putative transcriptional regulator n=1 Tax=Kibdelosporangium aridum TaxID=2030 RepID=UPI0035EF4DB0